MTSLRPFPAPALQHVDFGDPIDQLTTKVVDIVTYRVED
jgi:hypothetical protein